MLISASFLVRRPTWSHIYTWDVSCNFCLHASRSNQWYVGPNHDQFPCKLQQKSLCYQGSWFLAIESKLMGGLNSSNIQIFLNFSLNVVVSTIPQIGMEFWEPGRTITQSFRTLAVKLSAQTMLTHAQFITPQGKCCYW